MPSWSQEAFGRPVTRGGVSEPSTTPARSLQVQDGAGYYKLALVADAASIWLTGQPLSEGAYSEDIFGTSGQEYANAVLSGMGQERAAGGRAAVSRRLQAGDPQSSGSEYSPGPDFEEQNRFFEARVGPGT